MNTTFGGRPSCFICGSKRITFYPKRDGYTTVICNKCGYSWTEEKDQDIDPPPILRID